MDRNKAMARRVRADTGYGFGAIGIDQHRQVVHFQRLRSGTER